jgi:hypothetical protein
MENFTFLLKPLDVRRYDAIVLLTNLSDALEHDAFSYRRNSLKSKVKQTKDSPLTCLKGCEVLRLPHCLDVRLTDGGEVSFTHRQHFTHQNIYFFFLVLVYFRAWVNSRVIVRLEALGKLKKFNDLFTIIFYIANFSPKRKSTLIMGAEWGWLAD